MPSLEEVGDEDDAPLVVVHRVELNLSATEILKAIKSAITKKFSKTTFDHSRWHPRFYSDKSADPSSPAVVSRRQCRRTSWLGGHSLRRTRC